MNLNLKDKPKRISPSTVGRQKTISEVTALDFSCWNDTFVSVYQGDALNHYSEWERPTVIVSDGAYGILGFEGDTSDHLGLAEWYKPHIQKWSSQATPQTTLWFWNSEIGWASVHPILEKYGWRYVNANVWNKGKGHIAGNVNTAKIRRFPVVSEVCVQYVFEAKIDQLPLNKWLLKEWKRSGLTLRKANDACGVSDAATRKYLDQGHLWYFPPIEMFVKLQQYANKYGKEEGKPYFSIDGESPATEKEWSKMRSKFSCPHGFTNIWERPALRGSERYKTGGKQGKAIHLNQKPLDLMSLIIKASSDEKDVIWEPFGGLFSASIAARRLKRKAFGAEIDKSYFHYGVKRLIEESAQYPLP